MGGKCPHRKVKKRRHSHKTALRVTFLKKGDDMVYTELAKLVEEESKKPLPFDEDLPRIGQFYCLHCDRYFANEAVREQHFGTKPHKRSPTYQMENFLLKLASGKKERCTRLILQ